MPPPDWAGGVFYCVRVDVDRRALKIVADGLFEVGQYLELERARGAHPDGIIAVVEQVVAGNRVDEDHKPLAIEGQPGDQVWKHRMAERQLAAPVGVGAHLAFVYTPE